MIIGNTENFLIRNTRNDQGIVVSKIPDFCAAEFLHHCFGTLFDLFLKFLERNMGDIESAEVDGFINDMDDRQVGFKLPGDRQGIIKGMFGILGEIERKENVFKLFDREPLKNISMI